MHIRKTRIEAFRKHCFDLIGRGYAGLDRKWLQNKEEPDVTGCLVEAIEAIMNDPKAPMWMEQYSITDNPPLNVPGKLGKSRPVVDIKFEFSASHPRLRYLLEAKWIGTRKPSLGSKKGYLGEEGISCFLSGRYPVDIGHAGMLGYVYSDNESIWAEKIRKKMATKLKPLHIRKSDNQVWKRDKTQESFHAFISIHDCPPPVGELHITHLLLRFC